MRSKTQRGNWIGLALAVLVLAVVAAPSAQGQTYSVLYNFCSQNNCTDGSGPFAGLVQATNGDLYGTTYTGGDRIGNGTVFKITTGGVLTTLHSFDGTDGSNPEAGLIQATDGNLYGTTFMGGANSVGAIFKITLSGTLTTLHSFDSTDGSAPSAGLVQDTNGDFYGVAAFSGANANGTVFKITSAGALTTLHSFDGTDGAVPEGGLVQATDGDLYGTTYAGGANDNCTSEYAGCGTVFKITSGGTFTLLYSFCSQPNCTDGYAPYAGLVQATNGDLYGTTQEGGSGTECGRNGCGTVFKITPGGTFTMLHSFDSTDGSAPSAGLVQATDGNLYGTTASNIFKITPSGTLTSLYSGGTDAGLVQDTNGNFYGTTQYGGTNGAGTVFKLSVGLGAFVETNPTSGKVGLAVKILGTKLTGATSVTFNGKAAKFKVVSGSEITTTVPTGATTGKVKVKTPSGTLTSNVNFRVP